jgi:hypothetical protein
MKNKNIVFVAGLGSTGSSALIDLFKEVDSYFTFENEFRLFVDPGGLINLRDALVDNWSIFQSDAAIRNFRKFARSLTSKWRSPNSHIDHTLILGDNFWEETEKYIKNLTSIEYDGIWYGIDNIWARQLNKIPFFYRGKLTSKKMYIGKKLSDEEFNKKTNTYISNLINYCLDTNNKTNFCFDENLSCMFPEKILNIMPGSKIILVIRHPKDVLYTSKQLKWLAIPENTTDFIKWQLDVYNGWMEVEDRVRKWDPDSEKVMVVKFEDIIVNYDSAVAKVFNFFRYQKFRAYTSKEISYSGAID